jgi:hypothetical protein
LTLVEVVIGGVALWLLKLLLGSLIGQQVKGSVPDYTASKARAAARLLPPDLAEEYEEDWLAELKGPLKDKPLSALKYALGLRLAARRIAARYERARFGLPSLARPELAERVRRLIGIARSLVVIFRFVLFGLLGTIIGLWFATHNETLVLVAVGLVAAVFGFLLLLLFRESLALSRERGS